MSSLITPSLHISVFSPVLYLSTQDANRVMGAENRTSIQDILDRNCVPADAEAIRFHIGREKKVVCIGDDCGTELVPEIHPDAYTF